MVASISIPEAGELIAHTLATLKTLGYATAAMIPGNQNPSNEVPEPENAPAYVAPGKQYADVRESVAHLIREMKNPERDSYNSRLDFTHASLAQMLDMLREPLYQHGLLLDQQFIKARDDGAPSPMEMRTTFHHIPTGTELHSYIPAYLKQDKRLDDCQIVGATFTYFRRYGLRGAMNITDGDDDADQSDAKKLRRRQRAKAAFRVWRETRSPRKTKVESLLNLLVAAGEHESPLGVAQAKSRNPFLMTPAEFSQAMIEGSLEFETDLDAARHIVLNYGLHDEYWFPFYKGVRVSYDELIDLKTDEHVTSEKAMEIVNSLVQFAVSAFHNMASDFAEKKRQEEPTFIPDDRPLTPEEERFLTVVESGHEDDVYQIADHFLKLSINDGLDTHHVTDNPAYYRRNWFNACRAYYVHCLIEGIDVERFASLCEYTMAAFCPGVPVIEDMNQKACLALEIASGNADSQIKLDQLNEIARRCDAYTKGYVDTLILCVENDEVLGDLPPYIPESELPY